MFRFLALIGPAAFAFTSNAYTPAAKTQEDFVITNAAWPDVARQAVKVSQSEFMLRG